MVFGPLGDEHHTGVVIALLAGQPLVDGVGDLVREPGPVVLGRGVLEAEQRLLGVDVPQAEVDVHAPVGIHRSLAVEQGLGVDLLPERKLRLDVHLQRPLEEGRRIDRLEQAGAGEVVLHHLGDLGALGAVEGRNGDRHRLQHALVHIDGDVGARRARRKRSGR